MTFFRNRSTGVIYEGPRGKRYPEQSTRQRERAKRYANYTNTLTGAVTSGLKRGRERGLLPKARPLPPGFVPVSAYAGQSFPDEFGAVGSRF